MSPHTDLKGGIESGLFKMMTISLGKHKSTTQYHGANVNGTRNNGEGRVLRLVGELAELIDRRVKDIDRPACTLI